MTSATAAETVQEVNVLRVPEPNVERSRPPKTDIPLADVENFPLRYPDRTRDAEALLVDPITNEVLLVHKSYSGTGEANVYRASLVTKDVVSTLEQVGSLPLAPGEMVTDGDVSPAG